MYEYFHTFKFSRHKHWYYEWKTIIVDRNNINIIVLIYIYKHNHLTIAESGNDLLLCIQYLQQEQPNV